MKKTKPTVAQKKAVARKAPQTKKLVVDAKQMTNENCRAFVRLREDPFAEHFSIFVSTEAPVEYGFISEEKVALVSIVLLKLEKPIQNRADVIAVVRLSDVQDWIENGN